MNRLDRLTSILLLLQNKKLIRAKDIADHFKISLRTVYRDIRSLEEAGVPIAAEAGEGYQLVDGYHLPPVMFTAEEASALFVGGKFVERNTDKSIQNHVKTALLKIHSVLPDEKKEYVDELMDSTIVLQSPDSGLYSELQNNLSIIQNSIISKSVLKIEYTANYNDQFSERNIEPLGLIYFADHWHLVAYCRLRKDFRNFRTDRIKSIQVLREQFEINAQFSLVEFLKNQQDVQDAIEFQVVFPNSVFNKINKRNLFGLTSKIIEGEVIRCTFVHPTFDYIKFWLLSFGNQVDIIYPDILRELVLEEAKKIVDRLS